MSNIPIDKNTFFVKKTFLCIAGFSQFINGEEITQTNNLKSSFFI